MTTLIGLVLALLILIYGVLCREIEMCKPEVIQKTKGRWNKRDKKGRFCK